MYGSTLREAQAKAKALEGEVAAGLNIAQNPTVSTLIDSWLDLRAIELRPQTIRSYRYATLRIVEMIGNRQARTITIDDARSIIAKIATTVSPNQGSRSRKIICMVWDDAVTRSVVQSNPWRAVPVPKHKQDEKRFLTEDELQKLDTADLIPIDRALISVLRYTGIRIGEATALRQRDVDFKTGYISIDKTNVEGVIYPPKTSAGKRKVPMPAVLISALREYMDNYLDTNPDGPLFPTVKGTYWGKATIWRHFLNIGSAAFGDDVPEDFTPHIFRHTYTHDLVAGGIPPLTAQVLLGHSSYAITLKVYAHFGWRDVAVDDVTRLFDSKK